MIISSILCRLLISSKKILAYVCIFYLKMIFCIKFGMIPGFLFAFCVSGIFVIFEITINVCVRYSIMCIVSCEASKWQKVRGLV